jgi:rhodanese-related sulfurtransferase
MWIMKPFVGIAFRALALLLVWSSIGLAINAVSSKGIPWVYAPPTEITISGVKVPLWDEKMAFKYFDDPSTTFVDTRKAEDYGEGHVKGAVSLPRADKEDRFPLVQPLLPEENRIVLYCYGPECEDAERVAEFLVQLDYKNMAIMSPGFPEWKKAGYPMSSRTDDEGPASARGAADSEVESRPRPSGDRRN